MGLWSDLVYESQPDGGDEGDGVVFHSDCCNGEFWGGGYVWPKLLNINNSL